MAFRAEIRIKEAKDKGLPNNPYIIVQAASHMFDAATEKFLFRHGLNRVGVVHGVETWSIPPSPAAAPLYLVALIEKKYGLRTDKKTRAMLDAAIQEHVPEDGLERFLGRGASTEAGNLELVVHSGSGVFIANCSETNSARAELLAGAGWLPLRNPSEVLRQRFGSAPYITRDPLIAANLMPFMTKAAAAKQKEMFAKFLANIKLSESQEVPEGFNVPAPEGQEYLAFQKGGIHMISQSGKGGLIADDMGLGKTIQGIGVMNSRPDMKRALVVCQANMRLKWVDEIEKWKIHEGLTVGHAEGDNWPDTDIVVINYDIVERHEKAIRAVEWDVILPDEAHNMKNEETIRALTILGTLSLDQEDDEFKPPVPLAPGGQMVHLTGTPKPSRLAEMWPLLSSSRPDLWGRGAEARRIFLNRYEPPVLIKKKFTDRNSGREYTRVIPLPGKPRRELEFQMRLRGSGSFIRRLKRNTPGLPQKFRTPIRMPFSLTSEEQKELASINADFGNLMEGIAARFARDITPGASRTAGALIDVIDGIAPNSPEFHEIARVRKNLGLLKAPICARFIADELDEDADLPPELRRKTVVFAHHKEVIDILERMIEARYPNSVCRYDGKVTSAKKREKLVQDFQTMPGKRIFLMSLSGATGITLTAAARERIVEPDWSPSNMAQIEDRIWRLGQEENCDIGYLFVPNSLDLSIGAALVRKMETDERALNGISMRGLKPRAGAGREKISRDNMLDGMPEPAAREKAPEDAQQLRLI